MVIIFLIRIRSSCFAIDSNAESDCLADCRMRRGECGHFGTDSFHVDKAGDRIFLGFICITEIDAAETENAISKIPKI